MARSTIGVLAAAGALLTACGTGTPAHNGAKAAAAHNPDAADDAFVSRMLPHHLRAIEVGTLAEQRGADPRVVAFGQRIVREQTPEANNLRSWVATLHLEPAASGPPMPDGYIDDAELARLKAEPVTAFDRDVLLDSATSEQGAATMAGAELAGGHYPPALALARSISGAPGGEIPELRSVAASLGP